MQQIGKMTRKMIKTTMPLWSGQPDSSSPRPLSQTAPALHLWASTSEISPGFRRRLARKAIVVVRLAVSVVVADPFGPDELILPAEAVVHSFERAAVLVLVLLPLLGPAALLALLRDVDQVETELADQTAEGLRVVVTFRRVVPITVNCKRDALYPLAAGRRSLVFSLVIVRQTNPVRVGGCRVPARLGRPSVSADFFEAQPAHRGATGCPRELVLRRAVDGRDRGADLRAEGLGLRIVEALGAADERGVRGVGGAVRAGQGVERSATTAVARIVVVFAEGEWEIPDTEAARDEVVKECWGLL